ncbi:UDP-galactopyranose mutase [Candidatus Syntrophocurvum alkaliphilum]|uniref:UDP-galactopyranose mutase n=1 Tax=Candidatus Syntrophocurvum alkaliphilum TaxID=2293317 RepID=A0A6I6DEQ3_9FIRM|nr:glycosyltransferase [Candidatus Syntrophocurvum alkaliphilum]QGU00566.1 UDP-galactopyranose mutase [Candidatus Syntrophocurvum alkaliphilum]
MSNINCILYPPSINYDYLIQRPQQLMKSFSEQNITCYYLNHIENTVPKKVRQINPHLYILDNTDPTPYLANKRPVVYFTIPQHIQLVDQYNPALVVYDSLDEPVEEFAPWEKHYHLAVKQSDLVITTSDKLFNLAKGINPNTYLVPNGCDYAHFSQAANKNLPVPADIINIPQPIIGYIGAVASWCDMGLIEKIAQTHSHCSIVLIGPLFNLNQNQIPNLPNVHWLGYKPYQELPNYAQRFNVGIIPFRKSQMTSSVNPIKMWEYLATGMPVVTSAIPEINKFAEYIYYSEDDNQFINNIAEALANQDDKWPRMALAERNSWTIRARQILQIIEEHLAQKEETPNQTGTNYLKTSLLSSPYFSVGTPKERRLNIAKNNYFKIVVRAGPNQIMVSKTATKKAQNKTYKAILNVGRGASFQIKTARARIVGDTH